MQLTYFKWPLLALFILVSLPVHAEALRFEGKYTFDWSGIRMGKLHLRIKQDDSHYEGEAVVKTSGILSMFSDHKSNTRLNGTIKNEKYTPQHYRAEYKSGGKDKLVDLQYDAQGNVKAEEVKPSRGARPEVPAELKKGTVDAISAVFVMRSAVRDAVAKGKTEVTVPVYDGVRRYDLIASLISNTREITLADGTKIPAVKWGLKRKPLGGFKDKEIKKITKGEPLLEFFLDTKDYTLVGFQLEIYGGHFNAWVNERCLNEGCNTKDTNQATQ